MAMPHLRMVEDVPDDVFFALRMLQMNNFDKPVEVIRDGRSALEYLLDQDSPLPAAVLLDLALPIISGHEILKSLRQEPSTRNLPVIVMVSSQRECDRYTELFGSLGQVICLAKPLAFPELSDALERLRQ